MDTIKKNKGNLLKKGAFLTDIHFGRKANSETHNKDCRNYIKWFCEQVRKDEEIDYIAFLGDWHETRSALNVATLKHSFLAAQELNELGMPVYFIIGNHDLYHRRSRDIHSVLPFEELDNFIIIDKPTVINEIENKMLFCPYMFHNEYDDLKQYLDIPTWAGHFEFRGFVITGHSVTMPTGPEAKDFIKPDYIFSGHFHKRQANGNVIYIGNTFPMDYGDAGDFDRGLTTYNHNTKDVDFINWNDCPKYIKLRLSTLLDNKVKIYQNARVKCISDIPISFEESMYIRQKYLEDYNLREFTLEESGELAAALTETETTVDNETDLETVDQLVLKMLSDIDSDHIDNDLLCEIYKNLKV